MKRFDFTKTPIKIKNLKIILGNKIINMIKDYKLPIKDFECIMDETTLSYDPLTGYSTINCKDTEDRLIQLDGATKEIKMKKDMLVYIVNIMYFGNSFNVLASNEEEAKSKVMDYISKNNLSYPGYENITSDHLAVIPIETIFSFIKNSNTEVLETSRFGY
jgi:hypothetical protein